MSDVKQLHESLAKPYRLNAEFLLPAPCPRCDGNFEPFVKLTPLDDRRRRRVESCVCPSCGPLAVPTDMVIDEGAIVALMEAWGAEANGLGFVFVAIRQANKKAV